MGRVNPAGGPNADVDGWKTVGLGKYDELQISFSCGVVIFLSGLLRLLSTRSGTSV